MITSVKYNTKYYPQIWISLEAMVLKLHECALLATRVGTPGWAHIRVNFNLLQEIGLKVGGGCSFTNQYMIDI